MKNGNIQIIAYLSDLSRDGEIIPFIFEEGFKGRKEEKEVIIRQQYHFLKKC